MAGGITYEKRNDFSYTVDENNVFCKYTTSNGVFYVVIGYAGPTDDGS